MTLSLDVPRQPFTRADLRALGWSRRQLTDRISDGTVRRVLHNVYQPSDLPDTLDNRAHALALVATPYGVFCDRTAAWLHGVDVFDYRELEILPPIDCFVLRDRHRVQRPECRGGERDLSARDITTVRGLRVTTPLRTALDLACLLPRPDGLTTLDMFMRLHELTRQDYLGILPRYRGRRGVVKARPLLLLADGRSESPGESRTRLAVHDEGLPLPTPQHWVYHQGVPLFRLDLAWPHSRVALEYDGEWHDSTDKQRAHDRERRQWLRDHGWTVIVVKRGDFSGEARWTWLRELRQALGLGH